MIQVFIPSVGHQLYKSGDKTHTVFRVDVLFNGRRHTLERRYSEFHALHKLLKKTCKVPDFPPKRVPNWMSKVQEQRRQGLEAYIQGVLWYNTDVPKELLDFLKVRHFHKDKKDCSSGSLRDLTAGESSPLSHRAVVGFYKDCYILPPDTDILENSVLRGVLQGVYQRQDHKHHSTVNKKPIATTQVLEVQQPQH
ncbi:sorting nexin 22 L homeolog [Xenopus laevis]|uniref:MGC80831 protein n=1 Tax=Xenopus laevis TaxID=8355 RepID=Q6GNW2_XENLA|nr:sorting nexin 22 L homeolog [Xenopus laevis]AAH73389.1 MGC80831 protein [Xenopus laevis]